MGHTCLHFTNLAFLPSQHQGTALLSCGVRPDKLFSDGGSLAKLLAVSIASGSSPAFWIRYPAHAPSLNNLSQKKNPLTLERGCTLGMGNKRVPFSRLAYYTALSDINGFGAA